MAKILCVDADAERTRAFSELVAERGHLVTVVTSAERAMLRVEQESNFDAVVLHLILPGIDGAEFCRWLQRWSSMARVPRVVFSGPETRLQVDLQHKLPRWLPADRYLHDVQDTGVIVREVERVMASFRADEGPSAS